jgi:hypothetical protein
MSLRLAACLAAVIALPAHALLIRADRDDAEYLELATRYASSLWLEPVSSGGALIAQRWILTDGESARRLDAMQPRPALRIGGEEAKVQAVFIAPNERLGLVLLAGPLRNTQVNPAYRGGDELGRTVALSSFGATGTIGAAGTRSDARRRAGVNTIDEVQGHTLGLRIKPLDNASDLQAAATDGDRGSPAYVENDDGIFVVGIAAASQPAASFGAVDSYVRTSTSFLWIEQTMLEQAKQEMNGLLGSPGS